MKDSKAKIVSLRTVMKDEENKRIMSKISQAERLTRLEERQERLASLLYDVSNDLDELRTVLRKLLKGLAKED